MAAPIKEPLISISKQTCQNPGAKQSSPEPPSLDTDPDNEPQTQPGVPYLGVLTTRILLFRVLYKGPLFSETRLSKGLQRRFDMFLYIKTSSDWALKAASALNLFRPQTLNS